VAVKIGSASEYTAQLSSHHDGLKSEGRQIETRGEPMTLFSCGEPMAHVFLGDANVMFCPKNHEPNFCYNVTISLEVESTTFVSPEAPLQYWCVGVLQLS